MEKEIISKTALIEKIADMSEGITKKDIGTVIANALAVITEEVKNGNEVRLIGFGTFKKTHREARKGRNPQTGEVIDIAASDSLGFKSNVRY